MAKWVRCGKTAVNLDHASEVTIEHESLVRVHLDHQVLTFVGDDAAAVIHAVNAATMIGEAARQVAGPPKKRVEAVRE